MKKQEIDKIIDIEINFCSMFSNVILKDYGKIYFNSDNKLSWDSNHAIITDINNKLGIIIEDIEREFIQRNIVPRIYNSFRFDEEIITELEKRKWKFEKIEEVFFYIHDKRDKVNNTGEFIKIDQLSRALEEVVLSDPEEGTWVTNTIRISLQRNNVTLIGLKQNAKLIGFYMYYNNRGITRVDNVYVHFEFRNNGFGKLLINDLIKRHYRDYPNDRLYLWTLNPFAKKIYDQSGFKRITMPGKMWNSYLHRP